MEEDSYLGFIIPASLLVLGGAKLMGTDAVLAVFVSAAVFGQLIPPRDKKQEGKVDDVVNRFFTLPVFTLLGIALPMAEWGNVGAGVVAAVVTAVLARRIIAVWALRPLLRMVHSRAETAFISWFGPIGISTLFYATWRSASRATTKCSPSPPLPSPRPC